MAIRVRRKSEQNVFPQFGCQVNCFTSMCLFLDSKIRDAHGHSKALQTAHACLFHVKLHPTRSPDARAVKPHLQSISQRSQLPDRPGFARFIIGQVKVICIVHTLQPDAPIRNLIPVNLHE